MPRNFDSSALTQLQKARAVAFFQTKQQLLTNSSNPGKNFPVFNPQTGNFDTSRQLDVMNGNYTTYTQGFPITTISVPPTSVLPYPLIQPTFVDPPIPIDQTVLYAFETVLTYGASQNYPPTFMSRYFYMWFMSVVGAWNWVLNAPAVPGTKDGWDFTAQTPLNYDDSTTWMVAAVEQIITDMSITGYNSSYLWNRTKTCHGWDDATLATELARIKVAGHWDQWRTALTAWRLTRNADGSATARLPGPIPTSPNEQYPNGATTLDPSNNNIDFSSYPAPTRWTPLVLSGSQKRYASPTWYNVTSTCPTAIDYAALSSAAETHFPSTAQRYAELDELLRLTGSMGDHEKLIAEWWAGGPNTVTPPGIFMWYWKNYMATYTIAGSQGINAFMLSGLQLTVGLFETSRVIWAQKLLYTQARPIQDIRRLWAGQTVRGYDGVFRDGGAWMPYQEANFVTPPFPDFPSGHSGFSSMFERVMTQWFGATINRSRSVTMSDLQLVTFNLLGSVQTQPFGTVIFPSGSSKVQPGVVPAAPTAITFTTWHEIADSAGLSRQCGGIHCISAHQGSVAIIGDSTQGLYKMVKDGWSF
jgi:hypothetical protein